MRTGILLFTLCIYLNTYSQKKSEFIDVRSWDSFLDDIFLIDSIRNSYNTSTYRMLVYQTSMDKEAKDTFNPDNQCVISSILFINIGDKTDYWCFTYDMQIHTGRLKNDSVFLYDKYLCTGVLKKEELDINSPNAAPVFVENKWILFIHPLRDNNVIYYEDNNIQFYFEDGDDTYTYDPLPERNKCRQEWAEIIRQELKLIFDEYCLGKNLPLGVGSLPTSD